MPYQGIVGNLGVSIGEGLGSLFGLLGYLLPIMLLYPVKKYHDGLSQKSYESAIAFVLLCFAILMLQALLIDGDLSGQVGFELVLTFAPFIGVAGVWIFIILALIISLLIILEDDLPTIKENIKYGMTTGLKNLILMIFDKISQKLKSQKSPQTDSFELHTKLDEVQTQQITQSKPQIKTQIEPIKYIPKDDDILEIVDDTQLLSQDIKEDIQEEKIEEESIIIPPLMTEEPQERVEDEILEEDIIENVVEEKIEEIEEKLDEVDEIEKIEEPEEFEETEELEELEEQIDTTKSHTSVIVDELEENKKLLEDIEVGEVEKPKDFVLPSTQIFAEPSTITNKMSEDEIDGKIADLLDKLARFKIAGDVIRTYSGPVVTTFEFKPAPDVKISKILNLQDDLAMALKATTIRIQAPIPGKDVVGIEVPNSAMDTIYFREIVESQLFQEASSPLTMILGKDIVGQPFLTDLKKLPHLLIAGTTGSGKSVGLNSMILSLLYKNSPQNLRLVMIDPKMLEFSIYNDIPHLITPVITEPGKAIAALANMVGEMERRYKLMAESRTKNIENYNEKVKKEGSAEPFPYIVIVIDELADLMMNGGKEVELSIARLAQKSRACGIHLIVATQRPSVDVVTGLIKANLPSRLSYRVGQRIDSKVILDQMGAESLLGRGDGLFTPPGSTGLVRIHAPWNTEDEIDEIVEFLKAQREPDYDESYLVAGGASGGSKESGEINLDPLFEEAKSVVLTDKKTSISYLQRKLQIGYNRSANIIEQLEAMGVLSAPNAKGNREIL